MAHRIMLVPVGFGVGLTSVSFGMYHKLQQLGINVGYFKPISQPTRNVMKNDASTPPEFADLEMRSIPLSYVEDKVGNDQLDDILEELVGNAEKYNEDVVIVEGLIQTQKQPYAARINSEVAQALGADIIFVATPDNDTPAQFEKRIEVSAKTFGGIKKKHVKGCIINKIGAPGNEEFGLLPKEEFEAKDRDLDAWIELPIFKKAYFDLIGTITWELDLISPRALEVKNYLNAEVINAGEIDSRRIQAVSVCARSVSNLMGHLAPGKLIVTPGDRTDIIIATCLSSLNGTKLAALLLTNGTKPRDSVLELCQQAFEGGLPVFSVESDTWETARNLMNYNPELPAEDTVRHERIKHHVADGIDQNWLEKFIENKVKGQLLSPPAFRYKLTDLARQANKLIVLPEGNDIRTIKAAALCAERKIARCQLLGNKDEILRIAEQEGVELPHGVLITDPKSIARDYIEPLLELRKHKGMTELVAKEELKDNVVLGTMMLQMGHVDGLVSGAVNTTANTIRPALQLVKTAPGSSLVSSVFFMLLPEQVLVYGDCAINPEPNAQQLADIAIQSADSAQAFGIEPRVAMISYSTGSSGAGQDVEKVALATKIAKEKRPDLIIDGPLQYDAAIMENVAASKAPNSPVAGKATVFVFPDLNTGNTTYKAVQRSADLVSIGPMLQGMNKPVNDLSRGALVDDIIYTIALTAIQATQ